MGVNKRGEMIVVLMTASKNTDMYLDVYEPIWFELGMIMDTVELYCLILV